MKLVNKLRNLGSKAKLAIAVAVVSVGVAVPLAVNAEFYPDRPVYDYNKGSANSDCSNPNDPGRQNGRCGSMDGPVFNSFINTPSYGDERAFLDARRSDQTAAGSFKNVLSDVNQGSKEVVLRTYVHNNANQNTNASGKGVAHNAQVRIALPTATEQVLRARSYISASNAAMVEDTVDMTANTKFRVEYVPGSATIYNNGPLNGAKLADSIVTTGAPIGYNSLNGDLPGCFQYEAVVQIRVKIVPVETPNLQLVKEVKVKGDQGWKKEVAAKPNTEVQWRLGTKNISNVALDQVNVRDVLPPHVQLVPGSVRMIDANQDTKQNDPPLFGGGLGLGTYPSGGIRYIIFNTTTKDDFEGCEVRVRNVAYAKSAQTPTEVRDSSDVVITKDNCKPTENPSYSCNLLQTQIVSGRQVKFTTTASANGGATIKRYIYNFGDGTEVLKTDQASVDHTYAKDGQYASRVQVEVDVNGQTKVAESDKCAAAVSFTTPPTTTPGQPGTTTSLPNTGAGDIVAIFLAVTVSSTVAYAVVVRRFTV